MADAINTIFALFSQDLIGLWIYFVQDEQIYLGCIRCYYVPNIKQVKLCCAFI